MIRIPLLLVLFFLIANVSFAESPFQEIQNATTPIIQAYYPEAEHHTTESTYTVKHNTLEFTLHSIYKGGEISKNTFKKVGPNHKGFLLEVTLVENRHPMAGITPQIMDRPYFKTFVQRMDLKNKEHYLHIAFHFGAGVNKSFKEKMIAALGGQVN